MGGRHGLRVSRVAADRERRTRLGMLPVVALLGATAAALMTPLPADGQTVVGCLLSGPEEFWPDMWLEAGAGRLFVADWTNARVRVWDADSLADLGSISLASYLPDRPQQLAGHEGSGTLFVVVDQGGATHESTVVVIDTDTRAAATITDLGWNATIQVDEAGSRLFAFGKWSVEYAPRYTLTAVDVGTSSIVGRIDVQTLMDSDSHLGMTGLNPVTGEIPFVHSREDRFALVNGRTLATEVIIAPESAAQWTQLDAGTWNLRENKLYLTTNTWEGYFVYDRDTGDSTVAHCPPYDNDGSGVFYSAATNRVYSGAEINRESAIIDGVSDECQLVEEIWGPVVGFVEQGRRAYYVGLDVTVLDEDSLTQVAVYPSCIPPPTVHRPLVSLGVAVDQSSGRVFARIWEGDDNHLPIYPGPETDYACILVLEDPSGTCTYSIAPIAASYGPAGGSGQVAVTTSPECSWTATANDSWVTLTSGGSGTGDGTVAYSVAANSGTMLRTGTVTIADTTFTITQSPLGPCVPDQTTLCLNADRFKVEVAWRNFQGGTGVAQVVPFGSADSGLLWFFNPDNWEMLVKVLDGCVLNGHYWVFAAATTNVEYTLRVTDTQTGVVEEWHNPLGTAAAALTDTEAFATCP